jgi:dolichyl-phosphate beta-glucosyltransferase
MIDDTINFLKTKENLKYEIIIVNDGSKDGTWAVIEDLITKRYRDVDISGVTSATNGGKGNAVKNGMRYARGKYILMLDADGATDISDFDTLYGEIEKIENENGKLVIGSRSIAHDEDDSVQVGIYIILIESNFRGTFSEKFFLM